MYSVKDIISFLDSENKVVGNKNARFDNLRAPEQVDEYTLDWIHPRNENALDYLKYSRAKVIIVPSSLLDENLDFANDKTLIFAKDPLLLFTKIANLLFVKKPKPRIHPSAIIDPEAIIGNNVYIGPFSYIGKCKIGNSCVIYGHVSIEDGVVIGDNILIKSGARIGQTGFGFVINENGEYEKFPQVGKVIIGDNVEIGANTCIDRGSLSDTVIRDNVKISSLCHVSHNVLIEENTIITGQAMIAGSTKIGSDVWIGPNVTLMGHQQIGKSAFIGAGSVVISDVPSNEIWVGNPAKYLRDRK